MAFLLFLIYWLEPLERLEVLEPINLAKEIGTMTVQCLSLIHPFHSTMRSLMVRFVVLLILGMYCYEEVSGMVLIFNIIPFVKNENVGFVSLTSKYFIHAKKIQKNLEMLILLLIEWTPPDPDSMTTEIIMPIFHSNRLDI